MRANHTLRFGHSRRVLLIALCLVAPATLANQIIPAGGTVLASGGLFDLSCRDVAVNGLLDLGTGTYVNVRDVVVGPSGVILGTGTIRFSGTLSVSGTIEPSVRLVTVQPTDQVCTGSATADVTAIPTLGNSMRVALAMLLLLPALLALRGRAAPRRRSKTNGTNP